jgi:cobalt-zinc-cadmium resistance protein CzcA
MLAALIDACLRHRAIVLLATLVLVIVGLVSVRRLPLDAFPDTTPIQVQINTNAPVLAPLEVERQISAPIEQAIAGLPGLVEVRSLSKFGFSQVTAVFDDRTNIHLARQVVGERLATLELPSGVERPALGPIATGLGEVFQYVVHGEGHDAAELRTLHRWLIRPQLVAVRGVAEINTWGGYERQLHVVVDPRRLVEYELTLDDLAKVIAEGNRNASGGVLEQAGESHFVQGVALVRGKADLDAMVVASVEGTPVHLRELAEVREGHELRRGAVTAQGQGEVVLGLGFMLMGENSREVTARLEQRLAAVRRSLPAGVEITPVYSRTTLIDQVLLTVRDNLLEGALLVVALLFAFLGSLRAGLIVALAIPLSMLFAGSMMLQFGIAGSLMSLGAIDFGLVVDSSVIMVENAKRKLDTEVGDRSVLDIVRDAALEVRRPTLFGELILAIVYLPILALEGVEGKLFRPMALTVIFALAGSMLLSVTLMPVLASLALARRKHERARPLARMGATLYRRMLGWALAHRTIVLGLALLALVNAGGLATRLGAEFVPRLGEHAIVINTVRAAGTSLDESVRYGTQIEQLLLERFPDEIDQVWTRTGTAEIATDPMGLEVSDVFVTLRPRDAWRVATTQAELVAAMADALEGMPGMRSVFTQPIEMRVNEMVAGIRADVGIKVFGDDFATLQASAAAIRTVLERIPGAADISVEQLGGQATLTITVDREACGRLGVPVGEVLEVVESLGTRKLGEIVEGQRRFDLVLRLADDQRDSAAAIGAVLVRTRGGAQLPLATLADIALVEGPHAIQREWAKRRITVQANVRGRDVASFVTDVRAALDAIALPDGYYVTIGGQFEQLERARERLLVVVPVALVLVFSLLYLTYGRARDALRIFTGVPFGAIGGVVALWLRDMPMSISAGVGFIALCGIAVLGDMVLVSRIMQLRAAGLDACAAIETAALGRLRPVLMTASVAALGFVPMALNTGVGAEIQRPLATVVIGGVVTSTLATLFVMPLLYASFERRSKGSPAPQRAK